MKEAMVVKLSAPVFDGATTLTEVAIPRLRPADRPVVARAIRAERRTTIRPLSSKRIGAVMIATVCNIPLDVTRRFGETDVRRLARIISAGIGGGAR